MICPNCNRILTDSVDLEAIETIGECTACDSQRTDQ